LLQFIVGVLFLNLAGCLPTYSVYQQPAEELRAMRAHIETVGVRIDAAPPEVVDVRPASGPWQGFKRGFATGAGAPIVIGTLAPIPGSALAGYLVAAITGPLGGVYGMFNYLPEDQVVEATRMLQVAADQIKVLDLRRSFVQELVHLGNVRTHGRFVDMTVAEPSPTDLLLEARVVRAGLKGLYQIDPPSSAFLEIEARLVRESDGTELLSANVSCYGDRRTYLNWGADAGQGFVDTLVRCVPLLAEKVIDDFFRVYPMPGG
jgi:hypothetical protein